MTTITEEQVLDTICWSADVNDTETILGYLDRMSKLRQIKIDRLFVDKNGPEIFTILKEEFPHLGVFFDAKYVEIPPKLEELAKVGCSFRPRMLNCMAGSLSSLEYEVTKSVTKNSIDGLRRFADVCLNEDVRPCAVSVLTTKTGIAVNQEFNSRGRKEQVLFYATVVLSAGFTDLVCSPQELSIIRSESQFDKLRLVTPGIRPAGSARDDQVNASTPRVALEAGSSLLVIGRPLHKEGDPAENLDNIVAEILSTT